MNTQKITPPDHQFRFPFRVRGNLCLIEYYSKRGVVIEVDPTCKYACACFDNSIDYNSFKRCLVSI